ncbi:MAG: PAS domain S-box protein [bacterium]|nr:PAS domain S-box protein [bacterium]
MSDKQDILTPPATESSEDISRFADSYASFNRIINTLQRNYIELKEEFSAQNDKLAKTNLRMQELTARNLAATEFLNSILDSLSAGVISVDQNGKITHFNPAASVMLGIPQGLPEGKHYREVVPPGDLVDANALRAAETGKSVDSVEKTLNLADGSRVIVSVSTAILRDENNRANGAVEVFHDLTRIKKMEQEIARLNTLAALGEMAATVAHQVRNPLSGILGYGSLLKRDMEPDDPRQKLVTKITDGVETLNNTVTTLLNYTRNDKVSRERVDFEEFISDTVSRFRRESVGLSDGAEITVTSADPPKNGSLFLNLDPVLFRQVLYNLFTNSCEAFDPAANGSKVSVVYRIMPRQRAAEMYGEKLLLDSDETVFELTVSDNGPGLKSDAKTQLFSPFFTTKAGGNGLGLAVAAKILRAHGGDIRLGKDASVGTKFVLLLPTRMAPAVT